MFRPSPNNPHGGPPRNNNLYSQQPPGMNIAAGFGPATFPMHGRGRGRFHLPFHGPSYQMFPPSGSPLNARPPPPPGSPPGEIPPPPPSSGGTFRSAPKAAPPPPPHMPKDPEMLKNIDILSSFVVKNGPQFENMARAKQAGDPKFAFLFGGERGSDAALGYDFYNWKKEHLMWVEERTKAAPVHQQHRPSEPNLQGKDGGPAEAGTSPDAPESPGGSDMDMEDDFAVVLPDPKNDKNPDLDRIPAVPSTAVGRQSGMLPTQTVRRVGVSSPAPDWKPDFSSTAAEKRPAFVREAGFESADSKVGSQVDQDSTQRSASKLATEVRGNAHGGRAPRVTDTSRGQRETTVIDAPRRRDTRRRTGFDRPCMEDVSPQGSPVRSQPHMEVPHTSYLKATSENGHREGVTKPSRWGPEPSSEGSLALDKFSKPNKGSHQMPASFPQKKGESSFSKDTRQPPDVAANSLMSQVERNSKDSGKPKPKSVSDQPVDEFGRLLRQGGSDSDLDDGHYGGRKKRRTVSRSRSRSPGDVRSTYRSPDKSPHGWIRSRSWSRSPRRNRSRSRTPPRDGRWGGEGRGDRAPVDRGGRRGASRGVGGVLPTCFDFLKGKCGRGSSCRYSHDENDGGNGHQSGKWSGGRGRDREQSQTGRAGDEGERNWGSGSGDDPKQWRPWEPNDRIMEEPREPKQISESKREEHGASSVGEPSKHNKGNSDDPAKLAEELGQMGNYQQGVSSSQLVTNAFTPPTVPFISHSQSNIYPAPISQAAQQQILLPNNLLSQHVSVLSSNSTSEPHSLVSPVSQQSPLMVSPTPHSQQIQFSSPITHMQQSSLSTTLQSQNPGQHQSLPAVSQINSFVSNPLHRQFTTAARNLLPGSSSPLQAMPPPFAAVPLGRPQTSFSGSQQPNFAQFSNNNGNNGQVGVQFGPPIGSGQPQMLRSPMIQTLQPRAGLAWMPGSIGPATTFPSGAPPQPLQQPSLSLQQPIQPLQLPPQSLQQQVQPFHEPTPQPPPPQMSSAAAGIYPYPLPSSYAVPSYSTLSSTDVPAQPRPSIQDQYDPLSDSLEPAPPGSAKKTGVVSSNQDLSQENSLKPIEAEQWRQDPEGVTAPLMTNAGEVVLENVSPGLPGHLEGVGRGSGMMGRVSSPVPQPQLVMENISPTIAGNSVNADSSMKSGVAQQRMHIENVSPPDEKPKEGAEGGKEADPTTKEEKRKVKEGRVLNLIRKAVAEHVKDSLKPTWKGGQITKDAFKTIAKKAVDKVMLALEDKGQIPKTQQKVDSFMKTSKPKIAKLVQGYVDKYAKS